MLRHKNPVRWGLALVAVTLLASCGTGNAGGSGSGGIQSYKDTKSMVLDILKTEDAQKALQEAMNKPSADGKNMNMQMLLNSPQGQTVQMAVKDILTDPNYPTMLHDMMTDPRFAGEFAAAIKKDNQQLLKDLMKDPEYQTMVINTMKGPDFERMLIDVMKSPEYRKQTMAVIQDSLQNPLFRTEMMSLIKKVMEEEAKTTSTSKEASKTKGSGQSSGGSSGKSSSSGEQST